tara:strand:+ start:610 stop:789 length:180 start_codon:yes stop_codon:yes gene_type:complete
MIQSVKKLYIDNEFSNSYLVVKENNLEKYVPLNSANTDYQAIQEWIAEGNTIIDNGGGE